MRRKPIVWLFFLLVSLPVLTGCDDKKTEVPATFQPPNTAPPVGVGGGGGGRTPGGRAPSGGATIPPPGK